jgi:hypothetical protein
MNITNERRILGIIVLMMLVVATPASSEVWGLYTYTVENDKATITGYDCSLVNAIVIPSSIQGYSVISIGDRAYAGCYRGFGSIDVPDTVVNIGNSAFDGCLNISSVTIPHSVTNLGLSAFRGCQNLSHFSVSPSNQNYMSVDGILFNADQSSLIRYPPQRPEVTYSVPNTVTQIADSAFEYSSVLTNIVLPSTVVEIGDGAFSYATAITSLHLPTGVTRIGHYPFSSCTSLVEIVFPSTVTNIGDNTFLNCSSLGSISWPLGVAKVPDWCFTACSGLTNVILPESVTTIGRLSFIDCIGLKRLVLPSSVSNINSWAFTGCTALRRLYCTGDAPLVHGATFERADSVTVYYLPGTAGWSNSLDGRPAVLWNPSFASMNVNASGIVTTIVGTPDIPIAIEVASNLAEEAWSLMMTTSLTAGGLSAQDEGPVEHRAYRVSGP